MRSWSPNFCCSECAGRVSVAIRSTRRRIAERFRWHFMKHRTLILFPLVVALSLGSLRSAEHISKHFVVDLKLPDSLGQLIVSEQSTLILVQVPVAGSNEKRPAPDASKLGLQVWLLRTDGTAILQRSGGAGPVGIGGGGVINWFVTFDFAKVPLSEISGIVLRKAGKLYCHELPVGQK